jgi:peptidoglycan biosynthesis protein MviN/MurJ (putative lipid II flippase)
LIYGPIGAAASGYLWASGNARVPLVAHGFESVVWCVLALALVPVIGVSALGIAWLAAAICFAFVLERSARRTVGARLVRPVVAPLLLAILASAAAWVVADMGGPSLTKAGLSAVFGEAIFLAGLFLVRRALLADMLGLAGRSLRLSLGRVT